MRLCTSFRISVNPKLLNGGYENIRRIENNFGLTLEELSRVSEAMAFQSSLLCFFDRQAGE